MRNARRKKMRDFRRSYLSGDSPSLYRMFDRFYPEKKYQLCVHPTWYLMFDRPEWDLRENQRERWIREKTGLDYYGGGFALANAPAWYRRQLNRFQRSREKSALHKAFTNNDWDDFLLPRYRHNVNYNWW